MKNELLLTTILCIMGAGHSASAQNVAIPDANFKAALVANTGINTNADAEIQVSEATAYTGAIDVHSMGIADMTGIQAFNTLTSLTLYNNQVTSLNVAANTALTYLDCDYNLLTGLNTSTNTALTGLYCTNNHITGLDVSANTALTLFGCGGSGGGWLPRVEVPGGIASRPSHASPRSLIGAIRSAKRYPRGLSHGFLSASTHLWRSSCSDHGGLQTGLK